MTREDLVAKILRDTDRTDITADVSDAVSSAIKFYGRQRLWFLEGVATCSTSASQTWYVAPDDFKKADSVLVTVSGSKVPLTQVDYSEINEKDDGTHTGIPSEWTFYNNSFRFYPVPDGVYVVTLSYHKSLDTTASASNSWTNDCFDLIRYRAEKDVYSNLLNSVERATIAQNNEKEEYAMIMNEHTQKLSTNKLKKSGF